MRCIEGASLAAEKEAMTIPPGMKKLVRSLNELACLREAIETGFLVPHWILATSFEAAGVTASARLLMFLFTLQYSKSKYQKVVERSHERMAVCQSAEGRIGGFRKKAIKKMQQLSHGSLHMEETSIVATVSL